MRRLKSVPCHESVLFAPLVPPRVRVFRRLLFCAASAVTGFALIAGPVSAQTVTPTIPSPFAKSPENDVVGDPLTVGSRIDWNLTRTVLRARCLFKLGKVYASIDNGSPVELPWVNTSTGFTSQVELTATLPGSYRIWIVDSAGADAGPDCYGTFTLAAAGAVPIVDPRVGAAGVFALGSVAMVVRRRRKSKALV
jgi:hypothetical protein